MTKPTWGDTVRVKDEAPQQMRPGSLGSVCGMRVLEDPKAAEHTGWGVGTTLYLVEFSDGEALEIPAEFMVIQTQDGAP